MKGNSVETRFYLASENVEINKPIIIDGLSKLANKDQHNELDLYEPMSFNENFSKIY